MVLVTKDNHGSLVVITKDHGSLVVLTKDNHGSLEVITEDHGTLGTGVKKRVAMGSRELC